MSDTRTPEDDALIPPREFYEIIGLAKTPVKEKLNPNHPRYDPDLPRPVKLGPNCYRYSKREALRYVALKIAARDLVSTTEAFRTIPIKDLLGMRRRAYNALNEAGIKNVGQLIKLSRYDLLKMPFVGKITADEIVALSERINAALRTARTNDDIVAVSWWPPLMEPKC